MVASTGGRERSEDCTEDKVPLNGAQGALSMGEGASNITLAPELTRPLRTMSVS